MQSESKPEVRPAPLAQAEELLQFLAKPITLQDMIEQIEGEITNDIKNGSCDNTIHEAPAGYLPSIAINFAILRLLRAIPRRLDNLEAKTPAGKLRRSAKMRRGQN